MVISKIKRLDVWIGKTIFHPIVIFLCRLLRCTQHRLHRDLWFLVALGLYLYAISIKGNIGIFHWFLLIFLFMSAILRNPNKKTYSNVYLRIVIILWLGINLLLSIYYLGNFPKTVFIFVILIAEYASTIYTLPPDKKKSKEIYQESTT